MMNFEWKNVFCVTFPQYFECIMPLSIKMERIRKHTCLRVKFNLWWSMQSKSYYINVGFNRILYVCGSQTSKKINEINCSKWCLYVVGLWYCEKQPTNIPFKSEIGKAIDATVLMWSHFFHLDKWADHFFPLPQ